MSIFFLCISTICFIAAYGIHMFAKNNVLDWCGYMSVPLLTMIPWISGFILAVIPETIICGIAWWWMFLINLIIVWLLGPLFASMFLKRFATGKGAGMDIIVALVIGFITLIIGNVLS